MMVFRLLATFKSKRLRHSSFCGTRSVSGMDVDHYEGRGKVVGTLIFIHGMSLLGREDPRIAHFSEALALAGYRVLVPDFPSIRRLDIEKGQSEEILGQLELLVSDHSLVPDSFGLITVSFSGVFALLAACRSGLASRLFGICLVGSYSDIFSVSSFSVLANRSDHYGKLIILRNYYREVEPEEIQLRTVLDRCISECAVQNVWNPDVALDQSKYVEGRVHSMLTDLDERRELASRLANLFKENWSEYQINLDFLHRDIPVLLIHGRHDRIVPAGESKKLARNLIDRGIPTWLCVTQLLSHGDSELRLSKWIEVFRLLQAFAWFFHAHKQHARGRKD
ncbi:MAG: hypothetical protein CL398_06520 [Acidiferrobacteraceae bacterium]|nr:hypothetical protein [Acidiferrobacteraceae bacterium]